jgi:hypothetical protein
MCVPENWSRPDTSRLVPQTNAHKSREGKDIADSHLVEPPRQIRSSKTPNQQSDILPLLDLLEVQQLLISS